MGSEIQVTGTVEFDNGLWIGNHLKARNDQQRVCTIPGVQPGTVGTPRFLRGQTEFQSAWVCSPVLRLTWPREVGTFVLFPDVRQNP